MIRAGPAGLVAVCGLAIVAALILYLAGAPIYTDDLWWHVKIGESYANEGPWPAAEPLLHTAHQDAPVQHEWLFGVAVYGVERAFGLHGLRALHALLAGSILWLAWSLFARASRWPLAACAATTGFALLAWWRLVQLRPDLVSIGATFLLFRLLLRSRRPPSWRRIVAALVLLVVWANTHSLFALGLALLFAALLSDLLLIGQARRAARSGRPVVEEQRIARQRALRLGVALGFGTLATLLNPRGSAQHLTFFTSSQNTAIWAISDEWIPFHPLDWSGAGFAGNPLTWSVADAAILAFLLTALFGWIRFLREPGRDTIEGTDPAYLGLALASLVAIAVSMRFLWMGAFVLLYLLRAQDRLVAARPALRSPLGWILALVSLLAALAYPIAGGFGGIGSLVPRTVSAYLDQPYVTGKYYSEGARFLRSTGLRGKLFNNYWLGGFLAYWLAPELRTYVDGRVEHYPPEVLEEVRAVTRRRGTHPGEDHLDLLARRGVDVFYGVGTPPRASGLYAGVYNAANLERAPDWLLVSRSIDHAIYLRRGARNLENLERVADYYEREGVPFSRERGLDPAELIRARPDWAAAHRMVPIDYPSLLAALESPDPDERFEALSRLGPTYALLGAYEPGLALERQASELRPKAGAPLRRQVYDLLRLDRSSEALSAARRLERLDPQVQRARETARLAHRYRRATLSAAPDRFTLLDHFPLLSPGEEADLVAGYASPQVE